MADWRVYVADLGTSEVELTAVQPGRVEWVLNQPGTFSFVVDMFDPQTALCQPLAREAHVKRNGTLVWAGPIIDRAVNPADGTVTYQCEGLLKYFGQRNIDAGADRTNYLLNPEFEDSPDLDNWTAHNTTATVTGSQRILGAQSAQLVQATALQDAYLSQTIADFAATGVGSLLTAVAWFKIDPAAWIGEALGDLGLVISRLDGSGNIITSGTFDIDGDTPRGSWQRAKAEVWIPPLNVEDIQLRLYSPGGTIWWDASSVTLMESLSSAEAVDDFLMDQATIVENVVLFLQSPPKDDLGITTDCPVTGVDRERHFQFADHTPGLEAILEFTEMRDGLDVSVTPDRVFHTHYRRKGTDRTATVTLSTDNCEVQSERFEGGRAASGVVTLGNGDGPDREEGGAADPGLYDGRTVEAIVTPRATVAIDTLDEMASEELARRADPRYLEVLVTSSPLATALAEGDIVDVDISLGALDPWVGDWRIVARAVDPALDDSDERLHVTLNPWVGP